MKTVNLQLSKELKEAGYPQEAEKWWWEDNFGLEKNKSRTLRDNKPHNPKNGWVYFASPTADEILEQLPENILYEHFMPYLLIEKKLSKWTISYTNLEMTDISLADAAAKMWLYLKKEGLL